MRTENALPGMTGREWFRKVTHMGAFTPALLLPWLSPGQALAMSVVIFLINVFVLPRLVPGVYRTDLPGHGALEIILYPAALLALIAAYGFSPESARPFLTLSGTQPPWYLVPMLAWFCLAFLDACMGIGCRLIRTGPTLPWNPRKPLGGMALGLLGTASAFSVLGWMLSAAGWIGAIPTWPLSGVIDWASPGLLGLLGLALFAALVESAWFGITDNLTIPCFVCVLLPLVPSPLVPGGGIPDVTWPLLIAPAAFGILANAGGMLTLAGALLGTLMAFVLMAADPWLFGFLGGFFALAVAATRFRFRSKEDRHVAEARKGKRGAAQVFGAMGAAVWMTPLVHLAEAARRSGHADTDAVHAALLVCAAPFIAKAMDTVSSEMGKAIGGKTISPRTFRLVAPGSEGGVSLAGTLWGLAAAAALSMPILFLGWGTPKDALLLVGIAFAANLFESYWGDWASRHGLDDGPHTNFLMTLLAALLAWMVWIGH